MGFRGFWFNNSQQFNTNKHPHCYIGTIKKLSDVIWGALNNITNPNYTTVWGDYGGDEMIHSALGFNNLSDNFAIENLWHKLPGAYTDNQEILYDANGKKMDNPKYVINIFYKLILPSTYEANEDTNLVMYTTDSVLSGYYSRASTLSKLCNDIVGVPCMYDRYKQPHCIITGTSPTNYLELPSNSELGFDSNLPVGTDIVDLVGNGSYTWGYSNHSYFMNTATPSAGSYYLNLSSDVTSTINKALLTSVNYSNGLVHYGINPSQATCGLPFKYSDSSYKALMPSLFTGYIMQTSFLNSYQRNTSPDKTLTGALYICLGVSKI